jgi:hypothetical protein
MATTTLGGFSGVTLPTNGTPNGVSGNASDRVCGDSETILCKATEFLAQCQTLGIKGMMILVDGDVFTIEILGHPHSNIPDFLHKLAEEVERDGVRVNFAVTAKREGMN